MRTSTQLLLIAFLLCASSLAIIVTTITRMYMEGTFYWVPSQ